MSATSFANDRTPLMVTRRGQIVNMFGEVPLSSGSGGTGACFGDILPCTDDTYALGSAAKRFHELHVGTGTSTFRGIIAPEVDDSFSLGQSVKQWNSIYAGSGGLVSKGDILPKTTLVPSLGSNVVRWNKLWVKDADFTGTPSGTIASGTFLPTASNTSNCSVAGINTGFYQRIGNIVTAYLQIDTIGQSAAGVSSFRLTLPINTAATFGGGVSAWGHGVLQQSPSTSVVLFQPHVASVGGTDTVVVSFTTGTDPMSAATMSLSWSYTVA